MITPEYRRLNEEMHRQQKFAGPDAAFHYTKILNFCVETQAVSILDYGCGSAVLSRCFAIPVFNYDPCVPEYAADPPSAEMIVAIDVLEHVEPEMLDSVLGHIRSKCEKAAYLHVALCADETKVLPDGRNPHLIIRPASWWFDQIQARFRCVKMKLQTRHYAAATFWCRT